MPTQPFAAPAKVNLCFEVLGRRGDGYHEVRTVYQAIDLTDQLELEPAVDITLEVTPHGAAPASDNLVLQAARLLQNETHTQRGARIRLTKRIPTGAGLGGGSSDAASTLLGLRKLWELDLPDKRLLELAALLGADVPFFIHGGTAGGEGRGEVLTPLPTPAGLWAVVLCPGDGGDNKTARLYGLLKPEHYSPDGSATERVMEEIKLGSLPPGGLFNTFENVAPVAYPGYASAGAAFTEAGARHVHLAGAGPSLFTVVDSEAVAVALRDTLISSGHVAYAAGFLRAWG